MHELLAKTQTHGQCFLLQKVVRNRKHKITPKGKFNSSNHVFLNIFIQLALNQILRWYRSSFHYGTDEVIY